MATLTWSDLQPGDVFETKSVEGIWLVLNVRPSVQDGVIVRCFTFLSLFDARILGEYAYPAFETLHEEWTVWKSATSGSATR